MKRQLQGIALILLSILLMLGYGNAFFFDLDFRWALVFSIVGVAGVVMTFFPIRNEQFPFSGIYRTDRLNSLSVLLLLLF